MTKTERIKAIERIIMVESNLYVENVNHLATAIEEAIGVDFQEVVTIVDKPLSKIVMENVVGEISRAISTNKEVIKIGLK